MSVCNEVPALASSNLGVYHYQLQRRTSLVSRVSEQSETESERLRVPESVSESESSELTRPAGMVWYGAPPTPWTAIVATRWWQLDRAPAEHAQTESESPFRPGVRVCSEMGFVSTGTGASGSRAASLRHFSIYVLSGSPPAQRDAELHGRPVGVEADQLAS
jgi:hypothetical protein